jgi:predicted nucleotidyltransferase
LVPRKQVRHFLSELRRWAMRRPDILGVALVGSYARNEATSTSDVDLVIVAKQPVRYLQDTRWTQNFGTVNRQRSEKYGKVTGVRVWYSSGLEVECGFTAETWCSLPIDEGTRRVVSDGIQILTERASILSRLIHTLSL